jgi:hypothetical protein
MGISSAETGEASPTGDDPGRHRCKEAQQSRQPYPVPDEQDHHPGNDAAYDRLIE